MAPRPVKGANDTTWELLAVYKDGEGPPCTDGHPTGQLRIYAGVMQPNGETGVARVDKALCADQLAKFMEHYNR